MTEAVPALIYPQRIGAGMLEGENSVPIDERSDGRSSE